MSTLDRVKARHEMLRATDARILTLDIERTPNLLAEWSLAPRKHRASLDAIVEVARINCVATKWYDERRPQAHTEWDHGYEGMLRSVYELLEQADWVIGFNSRSFDIKLLTAAFIEQGWGPPLPFDQVDLLTELRRVGKWESMKLDHICDRLLEERKLDHEGMQMWMQVMAGDEKARRKYVRYAKQDVILTERLFDRVRGWIRTPNINLIRNQRVAGCSTCGSDDQQKAGFRSLTTGKYRLFRCNVCGKVDRSTVSEERVYRRGAV